ncbi:hypothetical protein LCGC14_0745110 [marine sediment metagenome]|uniref:Uncharacterized protein n=1 Tax=marine sediment metagenome TaxID=412755 RepID=A0A0F9QQN6_9ZZZZ
MYKKLFVIKDFIRHVAVNELLLQIIYNLSKKYF